MLYVIKVLKHRMSNSAHVKSYDRHAVSLFELKYSNAQMCVLMCEACNSITIKYGYG